MVVNDPLVITNVILATAIALRLMIFRKHGTHHQCWASWLAYVLVLAYASIPFRYFFDHYDQTSWATVSINLIFCAAVFRARGNIALFLAVLKPQK
ncbi:phage holin family protein [Erwinia sp. E_sp_B04_7]|uniref:phage holin family protein n=1 Tax=unclassified Erwinia TaxID=2622719 RepID=UPI0030CE2F88